MDRQDQMNQLCGIPQYEEGFDYHEKLLRTLVNNGQMTYVSLKFKSHLDNSEKAKYALTLLKEYHLLPKITPRQPKNEKTALKLRNRGNECFKHRNYFAALQAYNNSICFADSKTESLSLAYANRSAVYFEWKRYDKCLENIQLAKGANYPERLMPKLDKRRTECLARQATVQVPESSSLAQLQAFAPKLSYPPHPNVPYIVDCFELVESDLFGRHVVAKHDLKGGDIVAIEKPFDVALLPMYKYSRCVNCLIENELSLIPCPTCTVTMYCSETCLSEAFEKFHKYECPIIDALYKLFTKIYLMAGRLVLTAMHDSKGMEVLETAVKDIGEKNTNVFGLKNATRPEIFKAVHMLATNEDKRSNSEMFQRGVLIAIMYDLFIEHTELKAQLEKDSYKDLFLNLMFRYSQASSTNFHTLGALERINSVECDTVNFGSAVFPFCSMLNHSCTPNIVRICHNTTQVVVVVYRPVKKGDQILDCYGFHHCLEPKSERQKELESQYKFRCACEACRNNYQQFQNLPCLSIPSGVTKEEIEKLQMLDVKMAVKNVKKYMAYLEKYDCHYPCQQVSEAQESLVRCLEICFGNISLITKE